MVTQAMVRRANLPSVSEQTQLPSPIKIRWPKSSESRAKFSSRAIGVRLEDRKDYEMMGVGARAFARQKTNVVFKTVEEAAEIFDMLGTGYADGHYTWNSPQMAKTFQRVRREIGKGLQKHGYGDAEIDKLKRGKVPSSQQTSMSSNTSSGSRGKTVGEYLKEKRENSTAVSRANDLTDTQKRIIEYAREYPYRNVSQAESDLGVSNAYIRKTLRRYHGRTN